MVLSALFFGLVDGFSKMLAETNSVGQIVWARYALGVPDPHRDDAAGAAAELFRTRRPAAADPARADAARDQLAMVLGVRYLPLADATVILFAAPFLVVAFVGAVPRRTRAGVAAGSP